MHIYVIECATTLNNCERTQLSNKPSEVQTTSSSISVTSDWIMTELARVTSDHVKTLRYHVMNIDEIVNDDHSNIICVFNDDVDSDINPLILMRTNN